MTEVAQGVLRARSGDRLVVRGHHVGERERDGEILEALGGDGSPPYVVRWSDDGHVSRIFPGSDAFVEHHVEKPARRRRPKARPRAERGDTP
jgi:hypothetical protein